MNFSILHIYGASAHHDDVYIAGSVHALRELREAIDRAIANGDAQCEVFVSDGEAYSVNVRQVSASDAERLKPHYTDKEMFFNDPADVYPWQLKPYSRQERDR